MTNLADKLAESQEQNEDITLSQIQNPFVLVKHVRFTYKTSSFQYEKV